MSGTKLKGLDLSNSEIEGMSVGVEELEGAIVSNMQILGFASLFGVVIYRLSFTVPKHELLLFVY